MIILRDPICLVGWGGGSNDSEPDPVIHFYEDFLKEYDPLKKVEMGVFYTPLPVVRFIVRGIDELLKKEFGVVKGLADNQRIPLTKTVENKEGKQVEETVDVHRVQLLDIATGTGTFLNETVELIYQSQKANQGRWSTYVDEDLLPRLHGFELMMASYTIAHLKLEMTLKKSGANQSRKRLGVYLSNTLDDSRDIPLTPSLFGVVRSIARESELASEVKRDTPIMVVMGNPPYSGISQNKHYTSNDVYKCEPGGKQKLQERKHWLDDDYVKFICFAELMIEKREEGIIGMITAHGYIDNPTFRGMRWHLRKTFDKIYILDLHGNSNKRETAPDGSEDKNVFDIKQGVSIIFGIKKKTESKDEKKLAVVYQSDLYGKRIDKFTALNARSIDKINWYKVPESSTIWRREGRGRRKYEQGFSVSELFLVSTSGIVTMGDNFIIDKNREVLRERIKSFLSSDITERTLKEKYGLGKNYAKWVIENRHNIILDESTLIPIAYRPFDIQYTYFNNKLVWRTRAKTMKHLVVGENIGLVFARSQRNPTWNALFVSNSITDIKLGNVSTQSTVAPLYLYTGTGGKISDSNTHIGTTPPRQKISNLNTEIVATIETVVGNTEPKDIFDYVYAMLHCPSYREKYQEFLKRDFPHVPYPKDKNSFWKLVKRGQHLRNLHLLKHSDIDNAITSFPENGSCIVENISYKDDKVYINKTQYWDGVPNEVWKFQVGGYQPAQKYLKDRKGRKLTSDEFTNYDRMIVSLNETIKVMKEIDRLWR